MNLPDNIRLVKGEDGVARVSSMEVAKRFGKNHFHVMRDIENLMKQGDRVSSNFGCSSYKALNGKAYRSYEMNRDGFSLLAMGFTGADAMKWKLAFLDAFNAMERELSRRQEPAMLTRMEILTMALEAEKKALALEGEVAELKPDAEGMRMLRSADGTMTLTQVAKMLEVKRPWLFDLLTECGWLYIQNGTHQPYAPLMKQGMMTVDPRKGKAVMRSSGAVEVKVTTLVTPKGLAKITEIVKDALAREEAFRMQERRDRERMSLQTDEEILNEIRHDDAVYGHDDD